MVDWIVTLKRQAEIAARAREWVDSMQELPNLSFTQASRIQQSVDKSAKAFDRIRHQIAEDATVDVSVINAANHLKEIWSEMVIDTQNVIREMLGLRIVPFGRVANDG
jgi:hypothetical protein